jgi:sortase B
MGYNQTTTSALQEVLLMDKKKKNSKILYWALIAIFATIFLISGGIVLDYVIDSHKHQDMMEDIRDLHTRGPDDYTVFIDPTTQLPSSSEPAGSSTVTPPSSGVTVPPSSVVDIVEPTEPKPTEPNASEPTPSDPVPSDPAPSNPNPTEPKPTESKPTEPQPTEPKPTEPKPTEPQPTVPTKPPHVNTTILSEMKAVHDLNNDVVGWLYIPNTKIDYPVLQAKDRPDYYLYRNFYKQYDVRGSIYAEEHCDVAIPSDVVVLHGHHMADGTMFHNVKYFMYDFFMKDNPYVYFDSLYTRRKYQVVMLFRCSGESNGKDPFFPYHTYNDFKNEADFNDFMKSIRKLAYTSSDVEVKYGDKLLLLSTCYDYPYANGRIVLVCKLIG